MKKSQAATEYLLVWGVVFISAILILGSLHYLGIFDLELFLPSKCQFLTGINCLDGKIENLTVTLILRNELGFAVNNITLAINGSGCNTAASMTEFGNQEAMQNGQTNTYYLACPAAERELVSSITMSYVSAESNVLHRKTGYLRYRT